MVKQGRRQRYILFHINLLSKSSFPTEAEFLQELRKQSTVLYHRELKDIGCWLVRFQQPSGIMKCPSKEKDTVIALLGSLTSIGSKTIQITTERTSGTIRGVTS